MNGRTTGAADPEGRAPAPGVGTGRVRPRRTAVRLRPGGPPLTLPLACSLVLTLVVVLLPGAALAPARAEARPPAPVAAPATSATRVTATTPASATTSPSSITSVSSTAPATRPAPRTVTLLTGDRVTVTELGGGRRAVAVRRAAGAVGAVRTRQWRGGLMVVPDEARPHLDAGRLDPRLFEVTGLLRQKLDGKRELPLIVTYRKSARSASRVPSGAHRVRDLPSLGGAAVSGGARLWRSLVPAPVKSRTEGGSSGVRFHGDVERVWLDGRVEADMAASNAQIGSAAAWSAGLTGKGVPVAVLDSGVDAAHPDLVGRLGPVRSFVAGEGPADRHGHGTHVAAALGGSGAASGGAERGVAPGAALAVGKVLGDQGYGAESEVIAGMEWAAREVRAKVVSMSLSSTGASDGTDPLSRAADALSAETGALFVAAAGNAGADSSVTAPAAADTVLAVAAVDAADRTAPFSSRGPRAGDQALKPDLSAPGVGILSARSSLSPGQGPYTVKSGTSMATPHVAGVAALLAERHPDWDGARLKDALLSGSRPLDRSVYTAGAGRLDVPTALGAPVTATGSVDFGFHRWPHPAGEAATRELTYTNDTGTPVRLDLSVQSTEAPGTSDAAEAAEDAKAAGTSEAPESSAATGAAEPSGATEPSEPPETPLTLDHTTLTVPAHGSATTTVRADVAAAPLGRTSGRVRASVAGRAVAHTAFGLVKEEERYDLTVRVRDRDGRAAANADVDVQPLGGPDGGGKGAVGADRGGAPVRARTDAAGDVRLRLPPGTYALACFLDVRGVHGADSLGLGLLAAPEVVLDRDREVTLDGRELREIRAAVGAPAEIRQLVMEYVRRAHGAEQSAAVQVPAGYDSILAAPTTAVRTGEFAYRTVWRLGKPRLQARAAGKRLREVVAQAGGTVPAGERTLPLVDVGAGAVGDYAGVDVRGKAVLVHRTGALPPPELARLAEESGAAALFVADEEPGRLAAWFGTDDNRDRPLAVASVDRADARLLAEAARSGRPVRLTGTPHTPYAYDLAHEHRGAIPATGLVHRPTADQLAVLDTRFHSPRPTGGTEFRYALSDTFPLAFGFQEDIALPATRTDHVSAAAGQRWYETVTLGAGLLEQRGGVTSYRGGTRTPLHWFRPPWRPWLGSALSPGQQRTGNRLEFTVPGWGDSGPDHSGSGDVWSEESGLRQRTTLYADGVEVSTDQGPYAALSEADPASRPYRLVTETSLDPARWSPASRARTAWTFRSAETAGPEQLPLLNLAFGIDTDLRGRVGAGRLPLTLTASYVPGARGTGRIAGAYLQVSYDEGRTWHPAPLKSVRRAGVWRAGLDVPRGAASVSLRAGAHDDRGGAVRQDLVAAVAVRP